MKRENAAMLAILAIYFAIKMFANIKELIPASTLHVLRTIAGVQWQILVLLVHRKPIRFIVPLRVAVVALLPVLASLAALMRLA
jgi:hypothetical protein